LCAGSANEDGARMHCRSAAHGAAGSEKAAATLAPGLVMKVLVLHVMWRFSVNAAVAELESRFRVLRVPPFCVHSRAEPKRVAGTIDVTLFVVQAIQIVSMRRISAYWSVARCCPVESTSARTSATWASASLAASSCAMLSPALVGHKASSRQWYAAQPCRSATDHAEPSSLAATNAPRPATLGSIQHVKNW